MPTYPTLLFSHLVASPFFPAVHVYSIIPCHDMLCRFNSHHPKHASSNTLNPQLLTSHSPSTIMVLKEQNPGLLSFTCTYLFRYASGSSPSTSYVSGPMITDPQVKPQYYSGTPKCTCPSVHQPIYPSNRDKIHSSYTRQELRHTHMLAVILQSKTHSSHPLPNHLLSSSTHKKTKNRNSH